MVWVRDAKPLVTKRLTMFTFRVEDAAGEPASDLELYMGMPGHAMFVRRDRRVFAHVHPSGSAPMAAMAIGQRSLGSQLSDQLHAHHAGRLPATVSFPYGFPERGDYRIFVQVKRAGRIDTGAFDVVTITILAMPTADGQPLTVRIQMHFVDGKTLDETLSRPLLTSYGGCGAG